MNDARFGAPESIVYKIQLTVGIFLGTAGAGDFGWPTIMGATGTQVSDSFSAAFPSGVPSQALSKSDAACSKPNGAGCQH